MKPTNDTERLDWLQSTHKTAWRAVHDEWQPTTETGPSRRRVEVFDGWVIDDGDEPAATIREAIDAAMSKEKP
jgi:hypothetical protein